MTEQKLYNPIIRAVQAQWPKTANSPGVVLFRNNTGKAYSGKTIRMKNGDILIKNPRLISFGLVKGASDLLGIAPDGRVIAIEVKTLKGKMSKEQENFLEQVRIRGGIGIAIYADNIKEAQSEAVRILKEWI